MSNITVTVKLFGAFREYGDTVELLMGKGCRVSMVKQALAGRLGKQAYALIMDSVLANDETVLPGDFTFDEDAQLSILPPVCGG